MSLPTGLLNSTWLAMVLLAAGMSDSGAESLDWQAQRTWVFAVGVLEWQRNDLWSSFPEAQLNRRDEQLVDFFRTQGVGAERIVYLRDAQCTKRRIDHEFVKLLDQTKPGDLFVFYYCGHGFRDRETGETWFANYDAGDQEDSAWDVRSIFDTFEKYFHGQRVLLLADCCHSGALVDEVIRRQHSPIAYAALTSSCSQNISTENWTFTDSILKGLRGLRTIDADRDGAVELDEIADFTGREMAFVEDQKSMFTADKKFPRAAKVAHTRGAALQHEGDQVEVLSEGEWYKARVLDVRGKQSEVHYLGYDSSWNEWVGPERLRPYQPIEYPAGSKIDAYWSDDGHWYPATVLKAWYGLHLVQYDQYDSSWNEWVGSQSIRRRR